MSTSANVLAIAALDDLRSGLIRFDADARAVFQAVDHEVRHTLDWLAERQAHWQREVRRRQMTLDEVLAALARCQASVRYDPETGRSYQPDCSAHEAQVSRARAYLAEAEAELRTVLDGVRRVQQAAEQHQRQVQRLLAWLQDDGARATALLERSAIILRTYMALAPPAPLLAAASSVMPSPPACSSTWVEQGIQDIPLDQVDLSDSYVHEAEDFKKVSYEEMRDGLGKLQGVVRPAVAQGADGDAFSRLDEAEGLDYAHGYRRIYDAFYGDSAIRLEQVSGRYQVVNGYHRLRVAQELGLTTIPATVVAQAPMPA